MSLEMKKRDIIWVSLIVVLLGVGIVAATWDSTKSMFHNSEDVKITIGGVDYNLQEAIDGGMLGGETSVKVYKCPDDYSITGGGDWASYGCIGQISYKPNCTNIVYGQAAYVIDCDYLGYLKVSN